MYGVCCLRDGWGKRLTVWKEWSFGGEGSTRLPSPSPPPRKTGFPSSSRLTTAHRSQLTTSSSSRKARGTDTVQPGWRVTGLWTTSLGDAPFVSRLPVVSKDA